jgi:transposase
VAYIGLDVDKRESGKRKGERGLTHQGDAELRRLLYLCAQANLRIQDSPFRQQYERERAKGLSSTAALCAVARKLARLCWSLHKHANDL